MQVFQHPNLNLFLGPPGTGKTTSLLGVMEQELRGSTRPEKIGFVSFTRKATNEAVDRATQRFGFELDRLPWFRTIHSMSFRSLGLRRSEVLQRQHYAEIGKLLGVEISGYVDSEDGMIMPGTTIGDRMLFCDGLARNRCVPLHWQWEKLAYDDISWPAQDQFSRTLEQYKRSMGLVDYTDMLEKFHQEAVVPKLEALIIDEAQDLSLLQWKCLREVAKHVQRVYVAGDDDQAIYRWAGADVEQFISLGGNHTVLKQSHRLPRFVYQIALRALKKIKHRHEKHFLPRSEDGFVEWVSHIDEIDMSSGTWLVLARNNYLLEEAEAHCRAMGYSYETRRWSPGSSDTIHAIRLWEHLRRGNRVLGVEVRIIYDHMLPGTSIKRGFKSLRGMNMEGEYALSDLKSSFGLLTDKIWHEALDRIPRVDRLYYVNVLKRGESLTKKPRIKLSTIHGAKGGEADNVVLLTDMSYRTYQETLNEPDDENRVLYVGLTRARGSLYLIEPRTTLHYDV